MALPFTSAVYDALWVEGKDIARISTLQEAAAKEEPIDVNNALGELDAAEAERSKAERHLRKLLSSVGYAD